MLYTTLEKIRAHSPCEDGWKKLLKSLGKTNADGEQLSLLTILESNGLDDALWALRAADGHDREIRLYVCRVACRVAHLTNSNPAIQAIETSALFAEGLADIDELAAVWAAAWSAAWASGDAAWDAARAAWDAARAAMDAARDAAMDAAMDAALAAARDAALAAARDAVLDAVWAAALAAARDAERKWQEEEFVRMLNGEGYEHLEVV